MQVKERILSRRTAGAVKDGHGQADGAARVDIPVSGHRNHTTGYLCGLGQGEAAI